MTEAVTPVFTWVDKDFKDPETVAMDDELFNMHDCRFFNLRSDGKPPETADDCEVCWLASK